ncbi:MAG: hypothetical protein HY508_11635 [Acidobacteria bacterium]|nr:hypothetical protein [Acidobacteriota bacterium]
MTSRFMKWLSIMALLLGLMLRSSSNFRMVLELLVCVTALTAVIQAFRAGKHLWGGVFLSIAMLFNPVFPFTFSAPMFFGLDLVCVATFVISLMALKPGPRLSIQGIIHPHRRIESL